MAMSEPMPARITAAYVAERAAALDRHIEQLLSRHMYPLAAQIARDKADLALLRTATPAVKQQLLMRQPEPEPAPLEDVIHTLRYSGADTTPTAAPGPRMGQPQHPPPTTERSLHSEVQQPPHHGEPTSSGLVVPHQSESDGHFGAAQHIVPTPQLPSDMRPSPHVRRVLSPPRDSSDDEGHEPRAVTTPGRYLPPPESRPTSVEREHRVFNSGGGYEPLQYRPPSPSPQPPVSAYHAERAAADAALLERELREKEECLRALVARRD